MEWKEILGSGEFNTQAELAKHLGVSRVRVTQMLNLLKTNKEALDKAMSHGEYFVGKKVSERGLREFH